MEVVVRKDTQIGAHKCGVRTGKARRETTTMQCNRKNKERVTVQDHGPWERDRSPVKDHERFPCVP